MVSRAVTGVESLLDDASVPRSKRRVVTPWSTPYRDEEQAEEAVARTCTRRFWPVGGGGHSYEPMHCY